MEVVANQYVKEAASATNEVITFPWRARYIEILNDAATDLTYKLKSGETYATLQADETVVVPAQSTQIIINTAGAYRLRAYG